MFGIGSTELLVIIVVAIVVLGPEHLPKVMRSITKAMSEFRKVSTDFQRTINLDAMLDEEDEKRNRAEAKAKKTTKAKTTKTEDSTATASATEDSTATASAENAVTMADETIKNSTNESTPQKTLVQNEDNLSATTTAETIENPASSTIQQDPASKIIIDKTQDPALSPIEKLALLAEQQQQQGVERALAESSVNNTVDSSGVDGVDILVKKNQNQEGALSDTTMLEDPSSTEKEIQGSLV